MGKKLGLFLACMFMAVGMAFAQKAITGTVLDGETGEPLIGVTVRVPGTNVGTVTNADGKFTVTLPQGQKNLNFSFAGMKPATVTARSGMVVRLETNTKLMDEAMVIAYGTQKKSSFTGSAAIVDAGEIGKVQVTNAVDALKGKAAGVQIFAASGQPDTESSIRIRGFNSLVAGQSPLIVVDGSPYDGSMNDIAPSDIESMTILKDAASTALYGARGGNGVILITTKSGSKGSDGEINVQAKWGANMRGNRRYDIIDHPAGYYETYFQGLTSYAQNQLHKDPTSAWQWANANLVDRTGGFGLGYNVYNVPEGQAMIGTNGKLNPNATLGNIVTGPDGQSYLLTPDNWIDEIYHTGLRQEYNVSASGSTDKGGYYTSVNYLGNEGIVNNSNYKRLTARMKADYKVKSWLKVGANVAYSHTDNHYLDRSSNGEGNSSSGNLFALQYLGPIYPVYTRDANGMTLMHQASGIPMYDYGESTTGAGITRPYLTQSNPLSDILVDTRKSLGNTLNGTGTVELLLPYGFTLTSINNVFLDETRFNDATNPYFGQYKSQNGSVSVEQDRVLNQNYEQRLNWHQTYGGLHDIDVMLGHVYYNTNSVYVYGSKHNMFSQSNVELGGAVVVDNTGSAESRYNTESWLGRAMYSYADRYYVHASAMRQASSAFHKNHWWGTFYSASAGWMLSKEQWFSASWVDMLKVKASYGQNGTDAGLNGYYYTNRYSITNSNDAVSLVPSTTGKNEKFSWETNTKFNVGVDFALFKNRLSGTIEYYNNHTNGLISSIPYAPSFGYTNFYDNVGNMRNHGVEVDLHGVVIETNDLKWSIYANLTSNSNKITELAEGRKTQCKDGHMGYSSDNYFFSEGMSRYSYFAKKFAGLYSKDTYKSTYRHDVDEADMVYDPSKEGMALYYKDKYQMVPEKNADGSIKYDDKGRVVESTERVKNADGTDVVEYTYTTLTGSDGTDYILGDVLPDVYGGFGTTITYKGFDLGVDFQYQIGGKVYDSGYASLMGLTEGYAFHKDLLNAWSPSNTGSLIPRLNPGDQYANYTSDRFFTNASYLTLNNVSLGYTMPKSVLSSAGISNLRFYVVGDNLFTWSKRKGLDPRQSPTGGSSVSYYSPIRAISAGVQLTF